MKTDKLENLITVLKDCAVQKQWYEGLLECRKRKIVGESIRRDLQSGHTILCFFMGEVLQAIKSYKRMQYLTLKEAWLKTKLKEIKAKK